MNNKLSTRDPQSGEWVRCTLVEGPRSTQVETVTGDFITENQSKVRITMTGEIVSVPSYLVQPVE